jgi:hypothetical protein
VSLYRHTCFGHSKSVEPEGICSWHKASTISNATVRPTNSRNTQQRTMDSSSLYVYSQCWQVTICLLQSNQYDIKSQQSSHSTTTAHNIVYPCPIDTVPWHKTTLRPGTHYPHVTWAHECSWDIQHWILAHTHTSVNSAYVTSSDVELWSAHMPARLLNFCCRTHFVRRELTKCVRWLYCAFTLALSEVCVQCPILLFSLFL